MRRQKSDDFCYGWTDGARGLSDDCPPSEHAMRSRRSQSVNLVPTDPVNQSTSRCQRIARWLWRRMTRFLRDMVRQYDIGSAFRPRSGSVPRIEFTVRVGSPLVLVCLLLFAPVAQGVEISSDGKVTFSLSTPEASKQVELQAQWAKDHIPLTAVKPGQWGVTLEAVPPGVWEYHFVIDGVSVIDPTNPQIKPQRKPSHSILHIPGTPPNAWDWRDVPHGTVHQQSYPSKVLGRRRDMLVYTPPGYEQAPDRKFPLLVLQHGSGDQHDTWVQHGKAHWILDNLIADGKAVPMMIVMIDGHPLGQVAREAKDSDKLDAMTAFERELFEDALPLVEATYRVEAAAEKRALAGLSMGGAQTLGVGLTHADRFGWLGCFSGAMPAGDRMHKALDNKDSLNSRLKLFWIGCGEGDFLLEKNNELIALLKEKGVTHEWHLTAGNHSWPVWRGYLTEFAPRLFH